MSRPARNHDLHGSVPETSSVALLLVDVINDLEFEGGERLLGPALAMMPRLAALKALAGRLGIPAVYVNDNFGRWRSDFRQLVQHCRTPGVLGKPLADALAPAPHDYFVLKPKHSGFYATTLDTLLAYLAAHTLIIGGLTTERCVLFTAIDAHMRDFHVYVPEDCATALDPDDHAFALRFLRRTLHVDTRSSTALDLARLGSASRPGRTAPGRGARRPREGRAAAGSRGR